MKHVSCLTFVALLLSFSDALHGADTAYDRELQQLIDQRNKAVAPIIARFNANAEQLMKRAAQAGDQQTVEKIKAEITNVTVPGEAKTAKDLKTQLVGTSWKAVPSTPLRGGLGATLTFKEQTVEPGGYKYEVDNHNNLTILFNGGDTQPAQLSSDGKKMKLEFRQKTFFYELVTQ